MKIEDERAKQTAVTMSPIRLRIITIMGEREMAPSEVAEALGYPKKQLGKIAYHFRPMVDFNLVRMTRTSQVRGAIKTFYRLQPRVMQRARDDVLTMLAELDQATERANDKSTPLDQARVKLLAELARRNAPDRLKRTRAALAEFDRELEAAEKEARRAKRAKTKSKPAAKKAAAL